MVWINGVAPVIQNNTFERSYDKAVYVQNASPTFANNTFAYSPNGLVLDGGGYTTPANGVLSNNTFSNNTYPVWQLNYAFPTYSGNTFTGNARQAIAVSGGISAVIAAPRTQAWPDVQGLGLPYMVVGDLTVGSYVTLQIDPGVVVKFQYQSSSIYKRRMLVSGVLDLLGTDGSPVVFTSERDDTYGGDANGDGPTTAPAPGDWGYIRIDTATTDFQHGIVRYGGYYAYDGANSMLWVNSASPTIQNNTFERAYDKAVFVAGGNAAIVNNNISNNAHYGVYVQSGSPTINYNDIYGNVDYGVYNGNSAVTVNATNNWWGNASGPSGAGLGSGDRVSTYVNFNLWTGNPYAPPATASVQASDGTFADKVQVTWAASVRATTYMVYRAASPTGTKSFLGSSIGTSYDDTRSAASVVFYYWVAGCNSTGCSDYGSSDTGWRNIFYPPANLQASNGTYTDKVQVTWEAVSGATLFEVYRADSVTGSKSLLGSPAASPYDDTSAAPVVTYYYWAKACNGATCSSFSDTDSGWRSLSAPANVQASDGIYTDKVSVSWDTLPGATYYEVYRAATAGGTKSLLGSPVASPYDDATAAVGTTYFYWVKACKSSICSDFSAYDLGWRNLPAPVDVQASDGAYTDKVRVVWNAVADAASYLVYRAESAGGTRSLLGNPADASFDDTTATPVATYYYWVRACTSLSYCSNESAYDTGWRNLVAPTVVVASDGTFTDKVQVTWNASEGATSYEVYRADTADGAKTLLGSPAVSPYDDLSAASFVTYYYWVKACRAGMCSDFSASDTGWKNLPVQASDGTYADKVKIAWDAVAGSTSYKVYRATSAGGTKAQIGNPTATQYNDTSAVAGATYYYWVRSCVGATCSNYSASDSGWRNYLPPINIQASDGEYLDKVQVTWDAHASAASYEVYRSDSAGGTKSLLGSPTATSFDDTTASPGTTYYYFVKACFSLGCTAFSASDNGWRTLTAPTTVQASDGAFTDKVQIAWTAASGATSYQVYRADTADGTKSLLGSAAASPYDDATAIARITYYYWVKSCLAANCSDFSASDAGWREITYPGNVRASDGTFTDKVQVSWNASSGALSYRVYRATSATGSKTLLGSPAASPYNDTSGTPGASYYYWVKTCTATLCSDFSASDTGWRKLTAPTGLAASDGAYTDKVTLSWTASAGATSYQVYRATSATGAKAGPATTAATFTNDTTATPGVTYYYFVKACRGANCSDFSVYDTGWRNLAPPTNVQASDGTFTDKVQITWTASLGATSYKLYRAASVDGAKTLLGSTTSTTANDTSATPGATYYYWVTACRGTVCSDYSVYDTGRR
jgi:fibronectin type 3 domain-containing protein